MTEPKIEAILCPNCRKLVSSDEPVCPYCGISKPGAPLKNFFVALTSPKAENVINYIIYVNVFMYIVSILFSHKNIGLSANPLTFLSPSNNAVLLLGASGTVPIDRFDRWWTLLSANYLHGGLLHIFFNMMALRQLGFLTMREYGVERTIVIYTVGGVIGYLVSYMAGVSFTIGASAAVCALIGAILYYGKSRGGTYGESLFRDVSGWVVMLAIFGLIVPGINNWGHGGGIVGGIIIAYLLGYRERKRETLLHKVLAGGSVVVTILVILWAIFSALYYIFIG